MNFQVLQGDCRELMKTLADCSVDAIVTDPPYELGFMGKSWDRSGIAYQVEVWRECLRVLKHGGHLLAFGGSRTYHRLACAIEDAGFEIRDQIQWLYGSGFPKSLDISKAIEGVTGTQSKAFCTAGRGDRADIQERVGPNTRFRSDYGYKFEPQADAAKQWNGWGTALKPAHEPIVMARKPLIGTVAENVLKHGTGGINVDGCRVEGSEKTEGGCKGQTALHGGGITDRTLVDQSIGRWPANVIHDGSDEVVSLFPDTGISSGGNSTNIGGFVTAYSDESRRGVACGFNDSGSAARFFYCAKASKEDREEGLNDLPIRSAGEVTDRQDGSDGLNSPRAGAGRTNGSRNHHPTVKPTELMRYLVRLVTPPNGIVFDPFCGSGSTGKAAMLEELNFIGIELSAEYCELAQRRIEVVTRQGLLFSTQDAKSPASGALSNDAQREFFAS